MSRASSASGARIAAISAAFIGAGACAVPSNAASAEPSSASKPQRTARPVMPPPRAALDRSRRSAENTRSRTAARSFEPA